MSKTWSEIILRSWIDENFKKELLANPTKVLRSYGIEPPEGRDFRIVENTKDTVFEILQKKCSFKKALDAFHVSPAYIGKFPDGSICLRYLEFSNRALENEIRKYCCQALKNGAFSSEMIASGKLYDKELEEGHFESVEIRWIDEQIGYGAFAERDIPPFTYIAEYCGVIKTEKSCFSEDYRYFCYYGIDKTDPFWLVDAKKKGNISRFVNHSEQPNLEMIYAYQGGLIHPILRSTKQIPKGSQLGYNYGKNYWKHLSCN